MFPLSLRAVLITTLPCKASGLRANVQWRWQKGDNSSNIPQRYKEENGLEKGFPHIWWGLQVLWLPCGKQIWAKWEMSLKILEERILEGLIRLLLMWAKLCGKPLRRLLTHSINQSVLLVSSKIINYHTNSGLQDIWVHTLPYRKVEYMRKYVDFLTINSLLCFEQSSPAAAISGILPLDLSI